MFNALVFVCMLVPPGREECVVFADDWGPYKTEENCEIRVNQMGRELFQSMGSKFIISAVEGACVPEEGELS